MQKITKNVLTRHPFFDIISLALSKNGATLGEVSKWS